MEVRKCGNEWKSVINARVKGTVCPVCAEREVLAGYNDLATTDNQLLSEWDYELNKLKPTEVITNFSKESVVEMQARSFMEYEDKRKDVLNKAAEFVSRNIYLYFLLWLSAIILIKKGLKAELGSDRLFGVPLETYIPLEQLAIESKVPMRI